LVRNSKNGTGIAYKKGEVKRKEEKGGKNERD
jgi:hypothetical protein